MIKIATIIFSLVILLSSITVKGQSEITLNVDTPKAKAPKFGDDKIFVVVEHEPDFKGGMVAFHKYLQKNILYPAKSFENRIQGNVFVTFIVEMDGSLSDLKVVRGVSDDIDAEAIRVIKDSPKWNPGMQNGIIVRVAYTLPISFSLQSK